jgi:purine catabolism regulator
VLRLADLLAEESFGLELISGGAEAGDREVRGAHAVEVEAPARWLGRGWVMLTTGVRLRRNPDAQRALVPQLEAEGVSALGFGTGLGFKRVPPALAEVARARSFPVFAVPYETPFREIIHFVESTLTSGEEHVFRRLTALGYGGPFTLDFGTAEERAAWRTTFAGWLAECEARAG